MHFNHCKLLLSCSSHGKGNPVWVNKVLFVYEIQLSKKAIMKFIAIPLHPQPMLPQVVPACSSASWHSTGCIVWIGPHQYQGVGFGRCTPTHDGQRPDFLQSVWEKSIRTYMNSYAFEKAGLLNIPL